MTSDVALVSLPRCCFISLWPFYAFWVIAVVARAGEGRSQHYWISFGAPYPQDLMLVAFLGAWLPLGAWMEPGTKKGLLLWPAPSILKKIFSLHLSLVFPKFVISSYSLDVKAVFEVVILPTYWSSEKMDTFIFHILIIEKMSPKLNLYCPNRLFFVVIPKAMLQKKSAYKILNIEIYPVQILNAQNLEYTSIQNLKYTILDVYLEIIWNTVISC